MSEQKPSVVALVDAGVPADQGLAAVGMLMQLAGNVLSAFAALFTFTFLFQSGLSRGDDSTMMYMFLILGLCIARSMLHRAAGAALVYGDATQLGARMKGVQRYIGFALAQSAAVGFIMWAKFGAGGKVAVGYTLGLALWPAMLIGLLALPRFKRFKDELPLTEDKGFEGASILMTVLGLCGFIGTATAIILMLQQGSHELQRGPNVLIVLSLFMLLVRSGLHVAAGISGLRETSVDRAVEAANRYANFGVISAFCGGGALLLFVMSSALSVAGLAFVCGLVWMLLAWPMIIRKFFSDRQFADLIAGDQAPVHRRAPDAGLTWLGWLLIGQAALTLSSLLPQIIAGEDMHGLRGLDGFLGMLASTGLRSIWWSVGLVTLQLWAGYELVRMSPQSKIIATVFGLAGIAVTLYLQWPLIQMLRHTSGFSKETLAFFGPLALSLVVPVTTVVLVHRKIAPTARARYRPRPEGAEPPSA